MIIDMKDVTELEIHEKIYATIECRTEKDFEGLREVVNKQRPKKPQEADDKEVCVTWLCPTCGRMHITEWKTSYCSECGQKIDWTGVTE